ncbi:hypothetical protein [Vibrio harveyi]|uniref:hypothetical protein n=1 Tax=Vibrio harveyi TaxID=669 RepID=UPI003CFA7967
MNRIYKIWLTLCSLLLTMTIYLVKSGLFINQLSDHIENEYLKQCVISLPVFISCIVYFGVVIGCTALSIFIARFLNTDVISKGSITTVETANDAFLPSYLGYFFVALSIGDLISFVYVFAMIFIFILYSKISYFNPVFLLFGYKFFHLTNVDGLKIVVITKKDLKIPSEVQFSQLKRINDYTFITSEF